MDCVLTQITKRGKVSLTLFCSFVILFCFHLLYVVFCFIYFVYLFGGFKIK